MSTFAIVLCVIGALLLLALLGGYLATRRREQLQGPDFERHVREADEALEVARSADKGWDRSVMEQAARSAAEERHAGAFEELHLVLVDDRPGVEEDRAHFVAVGPTGQVRVVLARRGDSWVAESIE